MYLQYGCPSENGDEIIVPLENIEAIKSAFLQVNSLINLKVEVIPVAQRFVGWYKNMINECLMFLQLLFYLIIIIILGNENTTVPIVLDVVGLSLIINSPTPKSMLNLVYILTL